MKNVILVCLCICISVTSTLSSSAQSNQTKGPSAYINKASPSSNQLVIRKAISDGRGMDFQGGANSTTQPLPSQILVEGDKLLSSPASWTIGQDSSVGATLISQVCKQVDSKGTVAGYLRCNLKHRIQQFTMTTQVDADFDGSVRIIAQGFPSTATTATLKIPLEPEFAKTLIKGASTLRTSVKAGGYKLDSSPWRKGVCSGPNCVGYSAAETTDGKTLSSGVNEELGSPLSVWIGNDGTGLLVSSDDATRSWRIVYKGASPVLVGTFNITQSSKIILRLQPTPFDSFSNLQDKLLSGGFAYLSPSLRIAGKDPILSAEENDALNAICKGAGDVDECLKMRCRYQHCSIDPDLKSKYDPTNKIYGAVQKLNDYFGLANWDSSVPFKKTKATVETDIESGVHTLILGDSWATFFNYPGVNYPGEAMESVPANKRLPCPKGPFSANWSAENILRGVVCSAHRRNLRVIFYTGFQNIKAYEEFATDLKAEDSVKTRWQSAIQDWNHRPYGEPTGFYGSEYFIPGYTNKVFAGFYRANPASATHTQFMLNGTAGFKGMPSLPGVGMREMLRRYSLDGFYLDTPSAGCEWPNASGEGCLEGARTYIKKIYDLVHTKWQKDSVKLSSRGAVVSVPPAPLLVGHDSYSPKSSWGYFDILYRGEFFFAEGNDINQFIGAKSGSSVSSRLLMESPSSIAKELTSAARGDSQQQKPDYSFLSAYYGANWGLRQVFTAKAYGSYDLKKGAGLPSDASTAGIMLLNNLSIPAKQKLGPVRKATDTMDDSLAITTNLTGGAASARPETFFAQCRFYPNWKANGAWSVLNTELRGEKVVTYPNKATQNINPAIFVSAYKCPEVLKGGPGPEAGVWFVVGNFSEGQSTSGPSDTLGDQVSIKINLGAFGVSGVDMAQDIYRGIQIPLASDGVLNTNLVREKDTAAMWKNTSRTTPMRNVLNFNIFKLGSSKSKSNTNAGPRPTPTIGVGDNTDGSMDDSEDFQYPIDPGEASTSQAKPVEHTGPEEY